MLDPDQCRQARLARDARFDGRFVTAVTTTLGLAMALGARPETLMSLAPRSVTSPIAMGIAEQIGGIPSLAAGLVLLTGSIGCALSSAVFRLL
uniref:LrgB family protein n=1 Tax=Staphylococcus aureus TaxID=1280 RepID=UPI00301C4A29